MPARIDVHFAGPPGVEGHERDQVRRFDNDARAGFEFTREQAAVEAFICGLVILARRVQFAFDQRRQERHRIDLSMRVWHGHTNRFARVFEDIDIREIGIGEKLGGPRAPQVDNLAPVFRCHLRGVKIVVGMIEDNIALSARTGGMKKAGIILKGRVIFAERGEIVGIKVGIVVVRHLTRARTKRAPVLRHLRPVLPFRGDAYPFTQQRVPAQFTHA